jgi:PAS domain S-box-containing protein
MLRFTALLERAPIPRQSVRYLIPIGSVGVAFGIVAALQHFSVRNPVILAYLAAIAVSFWYGKKGPGLFAFALSTICLLGNFLSFEHRWIHILFYDAPILCLYVGFAWWIQVFADSRHHLESVLRRNGEELEAAVKARTSELTRINAEYKTILDSSPFGIALLGAKRIVERCNPAYEMMIGYSVGEMAGLPAPLPEEERESWRKHEDALRIGRRVVDYEALRMRRDGSQFSATIWMTPLQDCRGEYRGLVGYILDNTERNAVEAERQMLTTLVERSPDLVAVTDETGRLTFINGAGRRLLGVGEGDDVRQIKLSEHFLRDQQNSEDPQWQLPLSEGDYFDVAAVSRNSVTGEEMHLCCASFTIPSPKPAGSVLHAFVAQDVSQRKEAETKLRMSLDENKRLLEENKALQEKLQHENISLQERNLALQSEIADIQRARFEKIIGESPAIRRTLSKVEQVAATDVTVLITGETGTGKELIAQAIHENSKRSKMPFRAINCAAFPTTLMASELFGHERGAFTGADRQRLGQFELASGGTLFLDEIGELPLETQAVLLRVLEEHSFERLGGAKRIRSDVRIVVATNRDLHSAMQKGEFRRDLFFRLNGFPIEVPPLRERKGDIPLLVQHFVQISTGRHGKHIRNIEKRAMEMLLAYSWPGNIRELRNLIDTSVIVSPGEDLVIDEELLFGSPTIGNIADGTLEEKLAQYERNLIERALTETHGRISGPSGAATLLGMPGSTLSARIRVLRIDAAKFKIQPE